MLPEHLKGAEKVAEALADRYIADILKAVAPKKPNATTFTKSEMRDAVRHALLIALSQTHNQLISILRE